MRKILDRVSHTKLLEEIDKRLDRIETRVENRIERQSKTVAKQIKASEARIEDRVVQRVAREAWGDYREDPSGRPPVGELVAELASGRRVNLGPGPRWRRAGWETVDLYHEADHRLDLSEAKALPFEDGSVSIVFASHLLEHLSDDAAASLLMECARILRRSGVIRLCTPCADKAMLAYQLGENGFFEAGGVTCSGSDLENKLVNFFASYREDDFSGGPSVEAEQVKKLLEHSANVLEFARWCVAQIPQSAEYRAHVNAYTQAKLRRMLEDAGFRWVAPSSYRQSIIPELRDSMFDNRPVVSLYVEAIR